MKPVEVETSKEKTESGTKFKASISFPLFGYIVKRILLFIPTLFIISLLTFILISIAPGDPAETMLNRNSGSGEGGQATNKMATEKSYQQLRHKLGLDLPLFYFTLSNGATCDTLNRIPQKDHRETLDRLIYDYGNWPQISAYYHNTRDLEWAILTTQRDSLNANALIELRNNISKLFISHNDRLIEKVFGNIEKDVKEVPTLASLSAPLAKAKGAYETMKTEQTVWKRYMPTVFWNGTNNQYHRWLLGDAKWFGAETDPTKTFGFLRGDFGISFFTKRPVKSVIWDSLMITMLISLLVIVIQYAIAIPLGVAAAVRRNSAFDSITTVGLFVLYSLPNFWIGTMAIFFLASPDYVMMFPPAFGLSGINWQDGFFLKLGDMAYDLALPIIIASYASFAYLSRQMRGSMLSILRQDYIRTAFAKGLQPKKVFWKHAFRNSLLPIITIFAYFFPALIGGSIILEYLFNIPGLGQVTYAAVIQKDYPMILTTTMFAAILTLVGYLVADILYAVVDPRISYSKKA